MLRFTLVFAASMSALLAYSITHLGVSSIGSNTKLASGVQFINQNCVGFL
jgi:hypothetical protein